MGIFSAKSETNNSNGDAVQLPTAQEKLFQKLNDNGTNNTNSYGNATTIAEGSTIEGTISCKTDLKIDGTVTGTINCTGTITIGKTGNVEGDINANKAEISGKIIGKLIVKDLTHFKQGAMMDGDITTGNLIIENGVYYNGKCVMNNTSKNGTANKLVETTNAQ